MQTMPVARPFHRGELSGAKALRKAVARRLVAGNDSSSTKWIRCLAIAAVLSGTLHASEGNISGSASPNYWQRSVQAEENGKLEEALTELAQFAASGGDRYLTHVRAAWLYYQKQDYRQSKKNYEAAAQFSAASITPRLGLASIAYQLRDWQELQRASESVLRLDPGNYQASLYAGEAAFQNRRYGDAVRIFSNMLTRYPEDKIVMSWLAWSYLQAGDNRLARETFARLLKLDPEFPLASRGYEAAKR